MVCAQLSFSAGNEVKNKRLLSEPPVQPEVIYRTMSSVSDGDHTQNKTKITQYGRNANFGKQNHEIKVFLTTKTVYFPDG